jgi:hypothetical protein
MREILKLVFIAFAIGSFGFTTVDEVTFTTKQVQEVALDCHYGQCYATAKSTGNRCKHCVSNEGDSYCYQHK